MMLKSDLKEILSPTRIFQDQIILGKYSFLNCLPLNMPIENISETVIKSCWGTPTEINTLLLHENINVGPISSVEYLRNKDKFILLEDLSISSQKDVGSVILFSKFEFSQLSGKKIAVANTSATSVNLLKLLMKNKGLSESILEVHYYHKPLSELLQEYVAVLYIGDPALYHSKMNTIKDLIIYDLAALWHEEFELPMVFGVWVAIKKWAQNHSSAFQYINECLIKAKSLSLNSHFPDMIDVASRKCTLSKSILVHYFQNQLSYDLSAEQIRSLEVFNNKLKQFNLL